MTNKKYQIVDHEYMNTGGGCMCSNFTIYNQVNQTVCYFICNEEGGNLMTVDSLNHDFTDVAPIDIFIIDSIQWDSLMEENSKLEQTNNQLYELYKECHFEYLKEDCKHFGIKVELPIHYLPTDLLVKAPHDYLYWAAARGLGIETDGYDVFLNDEYEPPKEDDPQWLADIKDFRKWFDSDECYDDMQQLSSNNLTIAAAGRSTSIPLTADVYDAISQLLDNVIKEY